MTSRAAAAPAVEDAGQAADRRLAACARVPVVDDEGHCVTCSDEALPATVLRIDAALGQAWVLVGGSTVVVDISLVDAVHPGETLLVHGGVALGHLEAG